MNFIKKLWQSKTIKGILVAAGGAALSAAKLAFPGYDVVITLIASALSAGGLGFAAYGRTVAQGPITTTDEEK
jgi:hypothetical protein